MAIALPLGEDAQVRSRMDVGNVPTWGSNWAWGLPLIVLTAVFHAYGLGLLNKKAASKLNSQERLRHFSPVANVIIGGTALSATVLHAIECAIWAATYRLLGASADYKSAMLYSMSAMTSYGHANLYLEPRWQMMGSLEALNGWILFGLTTAFLFSVIQKAWPHA
jgi:hypothetical protein